MSQQHQPPPHVNTGGGLYTSGNVYGHEIVGRDKYVTNVHASYTMRRTGRVLEILGILATVVGFAMFGYVVVSFIGTIWNSMGDSSQPDLSGIPFMPFVPLGLGLGVLGTVFALLGLFFVRRTR